MHLNSTINWLAVVVLGAITAARIVDPVTAAETEAKNEVDTQFIFGFTAGADVGELGEKEIEHETIGRFGKRSGTYVGLSDQLLAEFVPVKDFRFEIGLPFAYYDIAGVPGLDDIHRGAFDGLTLSARYKLLDRERSPFALALGVEPHWSRVEENSGERVENYGGELSIAADTAIVKDRVFGAINIIYDPEITRLRATGLWQREATLGLFTSLTTQVRTGLFLGGEARYLRRYEGLDLDPFVGHALFIGPTMFARLSKTLAISGAWDVQVVGHAVNAAGTLDLTNFTRHQAMFRLEVYAFTGAHQVCKSFVRGGVMNRHILLLGVIMATIDGGPARVLDRARGGATPPYFCSMITGVELTRYSRRNARLSAAVTRVQGASNVAAGGRMVGDALTGAEEAEPTGDRRGIHCWWSATVFCHRQSRGVRCGTAYY